MQVLSKSKYSIFEECPYRAYSLNKGAIVNSQPSEQAMLGTIAHDIANIYLSSQSLEKIGMKYPVELVSQTMETMYGLNKVWEHSRTYKIVPESDEEEARVWYELEKSVKIPLPEVAPDFSLSARFDLFGFKDVSYIDQDGDIQYKQHACVTEFKTSHKLKEEKDTEALLYAYIAYKLHKQPVLFTRFSLRTGRKWEAEFPVEFLKTLEEIFIGEFKNYINTMNSPTPPEARCGSHCRYCDVAEWCPIKEKEPESDQDHFNLLEWAKAIVAREETYLKAKGKNILESEEYEDDNILLPGTNLSVVLTSTPSYSLKSRKDKKEQVISSILQNIMVQKLTESLDEAAAQTIAETYITDEKFATLLSALDVKFKEESVRELVESYGFEIKETVRNTIAIKAPEEEVDEDE